MQEGGSLLKQYLDIKKEYKDVIVFFRLGDFYEMFFDDAKIASSALNIILTSREVKKGKRIPMAGVPYHAAGSYIQRLIDAGHKVAICEQQEDTDNKRRKGLVDRKIIRVITPGTCILQEELTKKENIYLAAIYPVKKEIGTAFVDLTTGELKIAQFINYQEFINELSNLQPKEVLLPKEIDKEFIQKIKHDISTTITFMEDNFVYDIDYAVNELQERFSEFYIKSLIDRYKLGLICAASALVYLKETQHSLLSHINTIKTHSSSEFMQIDRITTRNLEIISSINEDNISLYSILDKTTTSMGKRLLKDWLLHPLLDVDKINNRQRAISELVSKPKLRQEIKNILKEIADLERLCARLDLGIITPKDLINLKVSLKNLIKIKSLLKEDSVTGLLRTIQDNLIPLEDLISLIEESICQEKPGSMIKPGFNKELDEINQEIQSAKKWIEELQYNEIKRTGISSIKVGYNKVFGYYIEVTKPNLKYVPSDYIRKQTLSNAERFITPELKEKEVLVLQAKERIAQIEQRIFQDIKKRISAKIKDIQENSRLIALLDVLVGLTQVVIENNYTKALLNNQEIIYIKDGRHPVVEKFLNTTTSQFIPNDTILDNQNNQVLIITGPNMAGKSTYIRQVGIIVLMAQVFGYVPAKEATIGLVDKLFARVGATDIIYKGQSTFMVEMLETANILNNATKRSLIILDEIGRGTSTYDGISIAWAVIEYIIKKLKSKTLFATHYHELIELEKKYKNIKNYSLAVIESDNKELIFSHKIRRGGILKSYGIEVANLAGLPKQVIVSAREILTSLEEMHKSRNTPQQELSLFSKPQTIDAQREQEKKDKIIQILNSLDIDNLTGLAALQELAYLKKLIKEKED